MQCTSQHSQQTAEKETGSYADFSLYVSHQFFSLAICCMVFVVVVHSCNLKVHSARTLITYSLAPNNANICLLNEYECCCLVRFFFSVYKCRVKCGHKFRLFVKGKCKIRKTRHENKCIEN